MNSDTILENLQNALKENDWKKAGKIVEENGAVWKGEKELGTVALETAVKQGCTAYVREHANDFDTFYMSYLHDLTTDTFMHSALAEAGICRDSEDYSGFRFAMESTNGTVLSFDPELQKECWEKYRELHPCSDEDVLRVLQAMEDGDPETADLENDDEYELAKACALLNVSEEDGGITLIPFDETCGKTYWDLPELLDSLGFDTGFEGDSWKMETDGVYYIE